MVCRFYRFYLLFSHAAFLYHSGLFLRLLYPSDRLSAICVEQVPASDASLLYSFVGYRGYQGGDRPCDAGRPSGDTRCIVSCVLFARGGIFPVVRVCAVPYVLPGSSLQKRRSAHYLLDNGIGAVLLGHGATIFLYPSVEFTSGLLCMGYVGGSVGRPAAGHEPVSIVVGCGYDRTLVCTYQHATGGIVNSLFIGVGHYR